MAQPCKFCQGRGVINVPQPDGSVKPFACPVCGGSGKAEDMGMFFVYEFTFNLTANQVGAQNTLNILNRAFKWMFAMAVSTGVFTVQLSDGSTQRQFSNQQVHVNNLFGTAQNPFPLLTPYKFAKKGQILAIASDLSGAPNSVRLAFAGIEVDE